MLQGERGAIMNRMPMTQQRITTEEEVYELDKGGAGQDIYNKGSWMLHTLRGLIGDTAFFDVTRRAVYGRPDPKPGNFTPRFGSTKEYEAIVRRVTGKDYGWFFDVYLRQAALPELIETRTGTTLTLAWKVPGNGRFPLPVEVQIDGKTRTLPMTTGTATLAVPKGAHVVIDPDALVLRRSIALEAVAAWKSAQAAKAKPQ